MYIADKASPLSVPLVGSVKQFEYSPWQPRSDPNVTQTHHPRPLCSTQGNHKASVRINRVKDVFLHEKYRTEEVSENAEHSHHKLRLRRRLPVTFLVLARSVLKYIEHSNFVRECAQDPRELDGATGLLRPVEELVRQNCSISSNH